MFKQIELITLNIASFGWIIASMMDYLPIIIGAIVGLSIAGLNTVRMIAVIKKWRKKKNENNAVE